MRVASAVKQYVPPQHGAWAFLGLPVLLALTVAPFTWPVAVLALAWVVAYPWSYAVLGMRRARRKERFRRALVVWSGVLAPLAVVLLVARPWLVWVGAAFAVLFVVNLRYASRNDERALVNDLVLIAECSAMVGVTWAVAVGDAGIMPPSLGSVPTQIWVLTAVCALVLLGSTLHVKSLIRERRDPRYARASRVVAVGGVPVSLALALWWGLPSGLWLVPPFVALAYRAFVVGRRPTQPGVIGLIELAGFVLVLLGAALA